MVSSQQLTATLALARRGGCPWIRWDGTRLLWSDELTGLSTSMTLVDAAHALGLLQGSEDLQALKGIPPRRGNRRVLLFVEGDREQLLVLEQRTSKVHHLTPVISSDVALSAVHELSNALTCIAGWAQLAQLQSERRGEALKVIERASLIAGGVARDILTSTESNLGPSDIADLSRTVVWLLQPIAMEHGVTLQREDVSAPAYVEASASVLFRVLWNLCLNAIQVQARGGLVKLSLAQTDDSWTAAVDDAGPGIPRAVREQVFKTSFSERPGGSGHGLATVKRAVESAKGSIRIGDSHLGGACITVSFARSEAPLKTDAPQPQSLVLPNRVLVVEDDDGIRELLETSLRLRGIEVVAVRGAAECDDFNEVFDVVIADLTLSDARGDVLLATLKARGVARRTVLCSGHQDPGPLVGPPDAWIPKPFDVNQLVALLAAAGQDQRDVG